MEESPVYLYMASGYIETSDILEVVSNDIDIVTIADLSYMKIEMYSSNFASNVLKLIEKYRGGLDHPIYIGSDRTDLIEIDRTSSESAIWEYLYSTF